MIWRCKVTGVVTEKETGRPLAGLVVKGFDKDLVFDDHLGDTRTDDEGHFELEFTDEAFRSPFDENPDLYLRVFDTSGQRELVSTRGSIRWNAGEHEHYALKVPRARLVGSPGDGTQGQP